MGFEGLPQRSWFNSHVINLTAKSMDIKKRNKKKNRFNVVNQRGQ